MKVKPEDGGCWFCQLTHGPLFRSVVLQRFLHLQCLTKALKEAPTKEELHTVALEFELVLPAELLPV